MTDVTASAASAPLSGGAFYRLVWKWHFLASLYVLPFMLLLSVTGGIYLFKPQIENWIYADRLNIAVTGDMLPLENQLSAVEEAAGLEKVRGILREDRPDRATIIDFDDGEGVRQHAWIDPYSAEILALQPKDDMLMEIVRSLHGELLLGDIGTKFVELAAHWAIIMFITGAVLWWPRGQRTFTDAIKPPRGQGRSWWRQTHLFTGMLATLLILPILISGLPWTDVWGGALSSVQDKTGQASKSLRFSDDVPSSTASISEPIPLDRALAIAQEEGLVPPFELRPAEEPAGAHWLRSASKDRFDQSELIIDQYTGTVLQRFDFVENPVTAKAVSLGISFHQGELYGWLNLIQNLIAALLGVTLAVSGFIAWWMRRPQGSLGVPMVPDAPLGAGMIVLVIGLALLFPLMGASLILALALDWLLFHRIGWFQGPTASSAGTAR